MPITQQEAASNLKDLTIICQKTDLHANGACLSILVSWCMRTVVYAVDVVIVSFHSVQYPALTASLLTKAVVCY